MAESKLEITEFSSIFLFGHSAGSSTKEGDLCYEISSCRMFECDQIFDSVQILGMMHKENFFQSVLPFFRKKEIMESKEKFMCFVLSRCLKLSENPSLFSFLIVCTFIDTIVFCVCNDVECFKVLKLASKCLTAAFNRWYVDLFDKENGFKGFATYCEKLNATVLNPGGDEEFSDSDSEDSLDLEGFEPPDTDEVIVLLKSFDESDESNISLTDFEKKLLYDLEELPVEIEPNMDIFIPSDDSSEAKKVNNLDVAMQNLSIKSKKVLKRVKHHCAMCEDNCYKYVVLVAKELKVPNLRL